MITVNDIMTTDPYTLKETDSIETARQLMADKHIRHIPIINDANTLVGLVTQRDLLAASISKLADVNETERAGFEASTSLKHIMTTNLDVIPAKMNAREAALRLQTHKYGCLPVVSKGKLQGIVTDSDFVAVAINLLEQLEMADPVDPDDLDTDL